MEIIKTIKTEEKTLKDLKFKVIDLDIKNAEDDFCYLEDNLRESLKEKLQEKGLKFFEDLKVYYSLSYCQGDGFIFSGTIETKKARFNIKHSGHYYHYNSKEINLDCLFIGNKEVYDFTDKQQEKVNLLESEFNDLYVLICKEMEDLGYKEIEGQEETNVLRAGFNNFLEENNINLDLNDLYNFKFSDKEEKGFIKICDSGNTNINGLFIENFKLKIANKIKAFSDITEYTEINII
ncbi:MAG: hypothetical protein M0R17_05615 [Candidatus Omnitrophica bacterium]|jgi:hypothetical protein|nr:hypothetical protein [Candidatus Omnitrophota bacterium]